MQEFSFGFLVGGLIATLFVRYFLSSYLSGKAKNLATKEDIGQITVTIESIRSNYALVLEELRSHHQLRLAALDARLEAQQTAFSLWKELYNSVHTPQVHEVVARAQRFWNSRCLYLTPEARKAFYEAYYAAATHSDLVELNRGKGSGAAAEVKANMEVIRSAGDIIVASINLPPIKGQELNLGDDKSGAA